MIVDPAIREGKHDETSKYLSEEEVKKPITGLYLLAAPSWDEDQWNFDDLTLPHNIADKLAYIPRTILYHCRDDVEIPFAHLAFHGTRLPQATIRAVDGRGHQFGNDLTDVARKCHTVLCTMKVRVRSPYPGTLFK